MLFWLFLGCATTPLSIQGGGAMPELERTLAELAAKERVPGLSACISRDGEVLWCGAFGDADRESGRAVTEDTPFLVASVSKTVVGIAALDAVEEGWVTLDAPINDILPLDITHPSGGPDITLRHLLAHTSGIVDDWDALEEGYTDGDSSVSLADFVEGHFQSADPWGPEPAGVLAEYSNTGSALAAYVIEVAAGVPFDDLCDQRIFGPLGMDHTGWHLADVVDPAMPYQWGGGEFTAHGQYGFPDYPNGQLRSTPRDLARLLAVVTGDDTAVLDPASVEELRRPQFPQIDSDQAVAWYYWNLHDDRLFGHNGGEEGASAEIGVAEDGVGFTIAMNGEGRRNTLPKIERLLLEAAREAR